ncbi:MAG: ribonuclease HIII [Candidatus Xiphinematobacter sp.]|nr:MAG: ribonuclease HIII [Candidatus Xiphinematobacter sp.]QQY10559.1 MAG: ribonuclease HIII [Candidatus Xiphinematobacter sp.]QQY11298.1 MAG: ribonuclease HIII [Candidatus Xiphinematobacter sp.]
MRFLASQPLTTHTYTAPLTCHQVKKLRQVLILHGFRLESQPHTVFCAQKDKLRVVVYLKGPKVLIQGKGIEDFITFQLEPNVLEQASFGYTQVTQPELHEAHFGIDESGKGDFFGPLVIAGAYVNCSLARVLSSLGVQDSKRVASDKRIRTLAQQIRKSGTPSEVIAISPLRYNELFLQFRNLNKLLAWGHARVLENLCKKQPDCSYALSDQFADARLLQQALMTHGRKLSLKQRTKAESDIAVAAASILARERLIDWLDVASVRYALHLPRGVSQTVKKAAVTAIEKYGLQILHRIAKVHFKTAEEVSLLAHRSPCLPQERAAP